MKKITVQSCNLCDSIQYVDSLKPKKSYWCCVYNGVVWGKIENVDDIAPFCPLEDDDRDEIKRLIDKAADIIGTDPELRSTACIEVALDWLLTTRKEAREEVEKLRERISDLELEIKSGFAHNEYLEDAWKK